MKKNRWVSQVDTAWAISHRLVLLEGIYILGGGFLLQNFRNSLLSVSRGNVNQNAHGLMVSSRKPNLFKIQWARISNHVGVILSCTQTIWEALS